MSRNRKFKKKMKNMLATVATLLLIIGVSVGVTLALLWGKTDKKENEFIGSKGVDVVLSEANWDGSSAASHGEPAGNKDTNPDYGINQAKTYTLGDTIPKDPLLTNLSDTEEVWVMLRVQYLVKAGTASNNVEYVPVSKDTFEKIAETNSTTGTDSNNDGIEDNWFLIDGTYANPSDPIISESPKKIDNAPIGTIDDKDGYFYYYCYKTMLTKDQATSKLFDNIKILDKNSFSLTEETGDKRYQIPDAFSGITKYTYQILPTFKIDIEGAAISWEENDPDQLDSLGIDGTRTKKKIISELQNILDTKGNKTDGAD